MMNGVSLPWVNKPRLGLIGNPENRRIRDFQTAVEKLGHPQPACRSYAEILADESALDRGDVDLWRIDSPGENEHVAKALISLGGGPANPEFEFGEVAFLREYHQGFCQILKAINERGIPCLNSPADVRIMFDKWASHERFIQNEIPRPPAELAPVSFSTLSDKMRQNGSGRIFLKPLYGSSASGVCALRWSGHKQQLIAPLRILSRRGRPLLVNSLSIHPYTTQADIELILGLLLPQGMIMEQWIPKLTLPGGVIDLRVLVIAGEARHWVIRQSQHPLTNLHLGNRRGDENSLRETIGEARLAAAFEVAESAAACFPDSLYAGVDILLDSQHRAFVGEINAFGDLLPRLLHRGESAYTAIARHCHVQRFAI